MAEKNKDMTLKEIQFLIKHIEKGSLKDTEDNRSEEEKKENSRRLVLKLIEEFGELAENGQKRRRESLQTRVPARARKRALQRCTQTHY